MACAAHVAALLFALILCLAAAPAALDLRAEEAAGGHTLARHVGKSDEFLRARLVREPEIAEASTFDSAALAEQAVGAALQARAQRIAVWVRQQASAVLRLDYNAGEPVGRVLRRGAPRPVPSSRLRVILRRSPGSERGWRVLTAFPEL